MSTIPFVLVALAIGVPLALVSWHLYSQWKVGQELDDERRDSPDDYYK